MKRCRDCVLFNYRSYLQYGVCALNNEDTNEETPACWQFEQREHEEVKEDDKH